MISIVTNYKQAMQEIMSLKIKKISKQKRKNQYTVEFKFGSDIDITKLQQNVNIYQNIPKSLFYDKYFRLTSNVQFPLFTSEKSLGNLTIDPHTYNYTVIQVDCFDHSIFLHLEAIQRDFTPFEVIKEIFDKQSSVLSKNFEQFHEKNKTISQEKVVTEKIIEDFEISNNNICYFLYIQKYQNGIVTTKAKIFNKHYLTLMGVNKEMLCDYCLTNKQIPSSTNNNEFQPLEQIIHLYSLNTNFQQQELQMINYQGNRFYCSIEIENFYLINQDDDSYTEYLFYKTFIDNKHLSSNEQIEINCDDYFNRKKKVSDQTQNRCQIKNI